MKHIKYFAIVLSLAIILTACGNNLNNDSITKNATKIVLSDQGITVDEKTVSSDISNAVYVANDIVYYEQGMDFTYGEGSEKDAHSPEEASSHTVVHITKPGTYSLSGTLSKGQIAVDLGEEAKKDPNAVVTLILNGANITCNVAPAVIFYSVYECGSTDAEAAKKDVDTSKAGANIIIADGTTNTINGAYVEKIYKPDTVVLNEDGTEVEDAKKLHKYDGALYSKMSMNVSGAKNSTGILNINAQNEGLDSELHLTINGGKINILSGNDGINTNEDGVSVTTVNGGELNIKVTGETGEGDGIDSNGWLVINGGFVSAAACSNSADAGIDSDMGIHINGGTVIATGHMLDRIEDGGQTYAVFNFTQKQTGNETVKLKNSKDKCILEHTPQNAYSILIYSSKDLEEDTYSLLSDDTKLSTSGGVIGGGMRPDGTTPPEDFEGKEPPQGFEGQEPPEGFEGTMPPNNGERPELPEGFEGQEPPEDFKGGTPPQNGLRPEKPNDQNSQQNGNETLKEPTTEFNITNGANTFGGVSK